MVIHSSKLLLLLALAGLSACFSLVHPATDETIRMNGFDLVFTPENRRVKDSFFSIKGALSTEETAIFQTSMTDIGQFLSDLEKGVKMRGDTLVTPNFRRPATPFPGDGRISRVGMIRDYKVTHQTISFTADFSIRDSRDARIAKLYRDNYLFEKSVTKWQFIGHLSALPIGDVTCEYPQGKAFDYCNPLNK